MHTRLRVAGRLPFALALAACAVACAAPAGRACRDPGVPVLPAVHVAPPPKDVAVEDDRDVTRTWMRNVRFHCAPGVVLGIRRLAGLMKRTDPAHPPSFDEPTSFRLSIDTGEIGLGLADMARLMNDHVFAYPGAPLAGIRFQAVGPRLRMTGTLARRVPRVSVEMLCDLCVVDGDVCMRPVSIRAAGVPVTGLMRLLGVSLSRFVDLSGAKGLRYAGRDLVLDPEAVLPSPPLEGDVTAARVVGDEVVLTFGSGPESQPPASMPRLDAPNSMLFERGTLRFGRLFMIRTRMQIVDPDPSDPFEFDLARYDRQLVAGFSRNQPDGGLLVVMPDADDVGDVERVVSAPAPTVPGR